MMDRQPFPVSGKFSEYAGIFSRIRTAECTVSNPAAFLTELRSIAAGAGSHIICFNADMMAGRVHAAAAMHHAVRAFESGTMISNTLEMEALLFAAGSRQCSTAASFGVHTGANHLFVCCHPEQQEVWAALGSLVRFCSDFTEEIVPEKKELLKTFFSITEQEMEASGGDGRLVDLVIERVALLRVFR